MDANGYDVLKWMGAKGYITPTQYQSAFDSKGNLTAEAKNDLKGIMYQSIFKGGGTRLEEMFNALPAKAQKAVLATAYRDNESPDAERMVGEIQDSVRAFYALMQDGAFAEAKNFKEARLAIEGWKRQYQMDDVTGDSYLPSDKFSNFALHLAAMYKGESQSLIQGTFNKMFDLIQGTQERSLYENPDNTPRTLAQAIKETLNIDYDGQQRSNVLAGGSAAGRDGQGGEGASETGERGEDGNGSANRAGGIKDDSAAGGRNTDVKRGKTNDAANEGLGEEITPSVGPFGEIYTQFKGKSREAVTFLLAKRSGEAIGALQHKDIGDIDLVWGKEGTAHSDGFGLAKLAKFHPEVLYNLQEVLDDMVVTKRSSNRVQLESNKYKAAVRLTWDTQKKTWLLTMFEKKNSVPDNTTDTVETLSSNGNDTATPENTVISSKEKPVSASSSDIETEPEGKRNGTATPQSELSSASKGNRNSRNTSELGEKNVLADADTDTVKSENLSLRRKETLESVIAELRQEDLSSGSAVLSDEEYEREAIELVDNNEEGDLYMAAQDVLNGLMGGHGNALSDEYVAWDREHAGQEGFAPLDRIIAEIERREGLSKRLSEKIAQAEAETDKNPTEKQKEAGNYKKGHVQIGLLI